jgi:hypothetical protein
MVALCDPNLDRGVVGDNDALLAIHTANTRDDATSRYRILVHSISCELRELEERSAAAKKFKS